MTQTSSGVWQRVLARAANGLWQQKPTLVVGTAIVAAMVAYFVVFTPGLTAIGSLGQPTAQGQAGNPDCADTVMAAVLGLGAPTVQQHAYNCMDTAFQQRVTLQDFSSQFASQRPPTQVSKVSRLGTYDAQSGAELVYYAVDAGQQSVGFVVYLNPDGKVTMID
jgi:hypothetical protein